MVNPVATERISSERPTNDRTQPQGRLTTSAGAAIEPEDPWALKIVLSLDGGGVRGYGSLLMLEELMKRVENKEQESNRNGGPYRSSFAPYERPKDRPKGGRTPDRSNDTPPQRSRSRSPGRPGVSTPAIQESSTGSNIVNQEALEARLRPNDEEGYYPCHYFDYIGGTSTGGLNAIMLGRLRMTVSQCLLNYPDMAHNIFSKPRVQIKGYPRNKHKAALLEKEIQKLMKARTGQEEDERSELHYFKAPDDLCRTFVVSNREIGDTTDALHIFRTYDNEELEVAGGPADDELIWKIGRATSAAPTYFKPVQIGEDFFSDGGILYNNPAGLAYDEVLSKEGHIWREANEPSREPIHLVLSIGTGGTDTVHARQTNGARENTINLERSKTAPRRRRRKMLAYYRHLGAKLTGAALDTTLVDRSMRKASKAGHWTYVRWHGGEQLRKLKLDEWTTERRSGLGTRGPKTSTQEAIEEWVRTYMSDPARSVEIDKVAEILVDVRRRRTLYQGGDLWKRWTYCSKFTCQTCGETDYRKTGTRARLEEHLKTCGTDEIEPEPPTVRGGPY